jgi:hypothetical protein
MDTGTHRISLKLERHTAGDLCHYFGLVRDGAECLKDHRHRADAWYMGSNLGELYGNGKYADDEAGEIHEGQIVSMEADLDKGTLRFWVDGVPHGPGVSHGVTGRLRWAVSLFCTGGSVKIVPTPDLQPWSLASWVPVSDYSAAKVGLVFHFD